MPTPPTLFRPALLRPGFLFALMGLGSVANGAPTGLELMKTSDTRHRLAAEKSMAVMTLQRLGGRPIQRTLEMIFVRDELRGDKFRLRFESPADVRGTTLLSVGSPRGEDSQWIYLPAFKKTQQVGVSELGDRFVGTDFYYEDFKYRDVESYAYRILGEETIDGYAAHVIESVPSAANVVGESPYSKSHLWMRGDILFTVKARHFDHRSRPVKEISLEQLVNVKGAVWRSNRITVVDLSRKHQTTLEVTSRQTDVVIPAQLFSRDSLASP